MNIDNTREMKCNGCGITAYAPNLNLVRDPRWGRAQEVYTEDPHLMSQLVVNFVTGLQNNTKGNAKGSNNTALQAGACCKHWAVYDIEGGAGTADRYHFNAEINGRNFWESAIPGFDACVNEGKAMHVMCSYNAVNGVPTCANHGLLTEILRTQWNYEGFVVSDYDAWEGIYNTHKYSKDMVGAAADGINAGMDQEGGNGNIQDKAITQLNNAIDANLTTASAVAISFQRLMLARIRLGMFDPPMDVKWNTLIYNETELTENVLHNSINRQAARASMTLFKNSNHTLPLSASDVTSLGLVGFQSNNAGILSGNYAGSANTGNWGQTITNTLKKKVSSFQQADGCSNIKCPEYNTPNGFDAAKKVGAESDVVVILLGLAFDTYCSPKGEGVDVKAGTNDYCENEGQDRDLIELPKSQKQLVLEVKQSMSSSSKLIAVLIHGGKF